ncbi:MAG: DUF4957 domain-containing protein [Bacteroidales bacterium]|nr:DUF4957 domain-containing protein [Bacteroidales bacterium]
MKSNTFKYLLLVFSAVMAFAGCTQEFREVTELDLTRCRMPRDLSATVINGDQVTFEWTVSKEAEEFTLALSETETFDVTEEYVLAATDVPYTIQLPTDKTYFWRVMAQSFTLADSKWAQSASSFSTYPVRSSLNPQVATRTETSLTITWDDAFDKEDLNSVWAEPVVMKAGDERKVVALTTAEIAECEATVQGLQPGREYKVTLVFGLAGERGSVAACTRPDMGEGVISAATAAEIFNAINGATAPVRVKVEYSDTPYDLMAVYPNIEAQFIPVSQDLYLYGVSTDDGKQPVLSGANFKLAAGTTVLHMEDIAFDGAGVGSLVDNDAAALTAYELINCEVSGYSKAIYVVAQTASATACGTFLVDGSYLHDINADGKTGGDFIDVRAGVTGDVILQNSTFYAVARSFLRFTNDAKISNSVLIANCTFNYVTATPSSSNNRGIYSISASTGAKSVQCVKNVFLNEVNEAEGTKEAKDCWIRLCRSSNDSFRPDCDGNVYFNYGAGFLYSTALDPANPEEKPTTGTVFEPVALKNATVLTDDPCVNSAAGKLYLNGKPGAQIVSLKAGDPRWWNAVQPEVVRPTELTVAPDEYTWDFTEKTIYDTEEITVPTIIGNARIYALPSVPAQVEMSKGISFSQGAVLSAGVPQYSAVGILTSGYGSVKVTAAGTDATVEVVADGDRYPVLADGKEHTVVLGDLSGENNIYVIADKEVTLTKITWTKDLTPEATVVALAKPSITLTPAKVDEGSEQEVVISWPAVANAADYVLTWKGVGQEPQTELTFTIPAAEVAALKAGEYPVSVVAYPVATSTKYKASEAAEAKLKIEEVQTGDTVTETWDFSSSEWVAALGNAGTKGTAIANWNMTVNGLTWNSVEKSKWNNDVKVDEQSFYYIQAGGTGSATKHFLKFNALFDGTLTVTFSNTGNNAARGVTVKCGDTVLASTETSTSKVPVTATFENVKAGDVLIYGANGAICYYKIEFTYPKENHVWDLSTSEWATALGNAGTKGTAIASWNMTVDGLSWDSVEKSKWNNDVKVDEQSFYYIQAGGTGSATKHFFKFSVKMPGTVAVTFSNTGNNAARGVTVKCGDTVLSSTETSTSKVPVTTTLEDVGPGDVLIYGANGAICYYKIEFHAK